MIPASSASSNSSSRVYLPSQESTELVTGTEDNSGQSLEIGAENISEPIPEAEALTERYQVQTREEWAGVLKYQLMLSEGKPRDVNYHVTETSVPTVSTAPTASIAETEIEAGTSTNAENQNLRQILIAKEQQFVAQQQKITAYEQEIAELRGARAAEQKSGLNSYLNDLQNQHSIKRHFLYLFAGLVLCTKKAGKPLPSSPSEYLQTLYEEIQYCVRARLDLRVFEMDLWSLDQHYEVLQSYSEAIGSDSDLSDFHKQIYSAMNGFCKDKYGNILIRETLKKNITELIENTPNYFR